jgi:hypothetical protein
MKPAGIDRLFRVKGPLRSFREWRQQQAARKYAGPAAICAAVLALAIA